VHLFKVTYLYAPCAYLLCRIQILIQITRFNGFRYESTKNHAVVFGINELKEGFVIGFRPLLASSRSSDGPVSFKIRKKRVRLFSSGKGIQMKIINSN
jgi:hypothetical protein